ncbi:unnamed protein product, partial [Polarella glacialis]
QRRRDFSSLALGVRIRCVAVAARRALGVWGSEFLPARRLLRRLRDAADALRARSLARLAFSSLLAWRRLHCQAVAQSNLLALRLQQELRGCCVAQWRHASAGLRSERVEHKDALLFWYVTLCSSALRQWSAWRQRRRQKKDRQSQAAALCASSQRTTAVRLLLWQHDAKCTAEESAAALAVSQQQQR